jgi:hypothetical protein
MKERRCPYEMLNIGGMIKNWKLIVILTNCKILVG